jgi:predicted MPP superfamily phosphohydrolase
MLIPLIAILTGIFHLISFLLMIVFPYPEKIPAGRIGFSTLACLLLIFVYGLRAALTTKITTVSLTSDKITKDLNIMLVADLHIDDLLPTLHLQELKKQIELQNPDLVLIAGDFFNRANTKQAKHYEVLS